MQSLKKINVSSPMTVQGDIGCPWRIGRGHRESRNSSEREVSIPLGIPEKVKLLSLGDKQFGWHH